MFSNFDKQLYRLYGIQLTLIMKNKIRTADDEGITNDKTLENILVIDRPLEE